MDRNPKPKKENKKWGEGKSEHELLMAQKKKTHLTSLII